MWKRKSIFPVPFKPPCWTAGDRSQGAVGGTPAHGLRAAPGEAKRKARLFQPSIKALTIQHMEKLSCFEEAPRVPASTGWLRSSEVGAAVRGLQRFWACFRSHREKRCPEGKETGLGARLSQAFPAEIRGLEAHVVRGACP